MAKPPDRPVDSAWLRQRAEELAPSQTVRSAPDLEALSPDETRQTLHELRVHQIELELQNEELRRAQGELDAARMRYFDLYDLAPVGYCTVSEKGLILEANLTAATLLGVPRRALIKQPLSQFIFKQDQDPYYLHRKQLLATGEAQVFELRMVKQDETAFWAQLTTTVTKGESEAHVCRVVLSDISLRKQAEAEREQLAAQLLQAQKMEAVGHLAGGIAHDFNNLLQVILAQVDLSLEGLPPGSPLHKSLTEVEKAAERAAELTRQLLAFGRRQLMQPVNLDLSAFVSGMLGMLGRLLGEHLLLRFLPGNQQGAVHADKGQLEQVIMNLCLNARDAMPGGGTLTLETQTAVLDAAYCHEHLLASAGRYALLRVTDTGCGMDASTRARAFEPFFTTKGVGHGSGLGLAMVYGIIQQHNGSIEVSSEPGQGTCFNIYLPLAERAADIAAENGEPKTRASVAGGTETILVAEDEEVVLKVVTTFLQRAGYTVLAAHDGEEALRVFEQHAAAVDLALLDVMMPKLGGRAVMDQLLARGARVRFLFSSGYSEGAIHTDFVIEQGLRLISKPHRREQLLCAVREALDADRS